MQSFIKTSKKFLFGVLVSILMVNSFAATKIVEGKDYTVISTQQNTTSSKVNVLEFFSFGCVHCATLEPLLETWQASPAAKNVTLQKIQVVWEGNFVGLAKLNATLEAMNLQRIDEAVFNAVMNQHQDLQDLKQLEIFLKAQKIDVAKFMAVYNSFAIDAKTKEYANLTKKYNISGTPTVIVDNRYQLTPAQPPRIMEVMQALVEKSLAENKTKKK